ncbi:MAG: isopentenyl phosphate kinase family protein [Methanomassiliicoccales archaeon]|nr:isopentenyl phosphate kinase family protein [Methanomassiliicoccales archaeon]
MILVKLGGSVITDKRRYRSFDQVNVDRLAREIVRSQAPVIIVHGAGSFGHVLAKKFNLKDGYRNKSQIKGLAQVSMDVRDLNLRTMTALQSAGLNCVSIPPSACCLMENGKLVDFDMEVIHRYLDLGVVPVTFGDVVLDRKRGFGICSGDQLMAWLADEFDPERIVFCTDVDGIFSSDPNLDRKASLIEEVDRSVLSRLPRSERCADVTGSIYGKIESILDLAKGREAFVINGRVKGRLRKALKGEAVKGSRVIGEG